MDGRAARQLVYSRFNPPGHWPGVHQPPANRRLCWKSADGLDPQLRAFPLSLHCFYLRASMQSTKVSTLTSSPRVPKRELNGGLAGGREGGSGRPMGIEVGSYASREPSIAREGMRACSNPGPLQAPTLAEAKKKDPRDHSPMDKSPAASPGSMETGSLLAPDPFLAR